MSTVRVLVVEDDPSVRGLMQTLLSAEGHQVSTAADDRAGLIEVASRPPALVLLDLVLPDLGGVRVLEQMREDPELAGIPVLVVTGDADAVPAMRELLGEDNVVPKPFAVVGLLARVADMTGGPGA